MPVGVDRNGVPEVAALVRPRALGVDHPGVLGRPGMVENDEADNCRDDREANERSHQRTIADYGAAGNAWPRSPRVMRGPRSPRVVRGPRVPRASVAGPTAVWAGVADRPGPHHFVYVTR